MICSIHKSLFDHLLIGSIQKHIGCCNSQAESDSWKEEATFKICPALGNKQDELIILKLCTKSYTRISSLMYSYRYIHHSQYNSTSVSHTTVHSQYRYKILTQEVILSPVAVSFFSSVAVSFFSPSQPSVAVSFFSPSQPFRLSSMLVVKLLIRSRIFAIT